MEDNIWWKTTFDERRPLMEADLGWKKDDLKNWNGPQQWGRPQKQRGLAHCWKAHSTGQKWKWPKRGRRPSMEDNLWRKTTFDRRRPLTEDDFWWKTTFDERWPLTEDELWWKTSFDGRRPLTEYDLWHKTTFDRRLGCIVYYLKYMCTTPHLDSHSTTYPKQEILSAV